VYPALVTVAELSMGRLRPTRRLLGALALSIAGSAVIVIAGEDVAITPAGIAFALGSALSFAIYLLVSGRAVARTDPMVNGAWVALGAAASLATQGLLAGGLRNPGPDTWLMVVNGVATASAFALLFAALGRLGPSRTAVVMTLEALSSVVLAAVLLGESVGAVQLVGGAAVLAATVLISRTKAETGAPLVAAEEL
jgi:drug/metabolite transporter (DMT)-like permease